MTTVVAVKLPGELYRKSQYHGPNFQGSEIFFEGLEAAGKRARERSDILVVGPFTVRLLDGCNHLRAGTLDVRGLNRDVAKNQIFKTLDQGSLGHAGE